MELPDDLIFRPLTEEDKKLIQAEWEKDLAAERLARLRKENAAENKRYARLILIALVIYAIVLATMVVTKLQLQ